MNDNTETTATEDSVTPQKIKLDIQLLALDGKGIPKLEVRTQIGDTQSTQATDDEGWLEPLQAQPNASFELAVKRLDGSFKVLDTCTIPSADTAWTYISPKVEIEVMTELHGGTPGNAEQSIPKPTNADNGDLIAETASNKDEDYSHEGRNNPAPNTAAPKPKLVATQPPQRIANDPMPPIKPKIGRDKHGIPLAVIEEKFTDWWGSWRMPTFNLWGVAHAATAQTSVPMKAEMAKQVKALIDFATEQTEYDYKNSGTAAAIVASMARGEFKHVKGEKDADKSIGLCYKYVKVALARTRIIDTVPDNEAASEAGPQLTARGFTDVTTSVPDARWAAAGDVIVYAWSDTVWDKRRIKYNNPNVPNYGHIDIRSYKSYISDFIPGTNRPVWGDYVRIRIYRKVFDLLPTLRMQAFLHCVREFECTTEADDSKRYNLLNTPLPNGSRRFTDFKTHPWATVPQGSRPPHTAAGAYQINWTTWNEVVLSPDPRLRRIVASHGEPLFDPKMQDRIAAALLETRGALPLIRQGKISEALNKLKTEWTSLPGGSQNAHRRNAAGKPMDMGYFMSLYEGYLTKEKRKAGL